MKVVVALLALFVVAGCSSTGVVPLDKDTYMVAKRSPKIGFVSADDEKAEVYRQANQFCAKQNKQLETINLKEVRSGFGRQASASLEFRCVAKASTTP